MLKSAFVRAIGSHDAWPPTDYAARLTQLRKSSGTASRVRTIPELEIEAGGKISGNEPGLNVLITHEYAQGAWITTSRWYSLERLHFRSMRPCTQRVPQIPLGLKRHPDLGVPSGECL
jgi:hypothetical protein